MQYQEMGTNSSPKTVQCNTKKIIGESFGWQHFYQNAQNFGHHLQNDTITMHIYAGTERLKILMM